jgi:hypothetical protein
MARLHDHPRPTSGHHRDVAVASRLGRLLRREQVCAAGDRAQHDALLGHRQGRAQAAANPAAERDPGVGPRLHAEEALGPERERLGVEILPVVEQQDADYYVACIEHVVERLLALQPDRAMPADERLRIGLQRYFESVAQHPEMHLTLRRVAPADVEVAAIVARDGKAFTAMVLAGMPDGGSGSALARAAARSWLASVEAAGLDWLEHGDVPAEQLIDMLSHGLVASMMAAAALDRSIELPAFLKGLAPPPISPPGE